MSKKLPIFRGYFVDVRIWQFRKVTAQQIEFIDFTSIKGEKILNLYIRSLDPKSKEFEQFIHHF